MSGDNANKTRIQLCSLRLEMGDRLGLRDKNVFKCLWIIDFPLFEWSDEEQRLMATHHPFTMPNPDDIPLLDEHPEQVRAKAYDFVCNGIEVGGGSLRIHDTQLQEKMFEVLGFTPERAEAQFGFLMNAFKYGAHLTQVLLSVWTVSSALWLVSTVFAIVLPSQRTTPVEMLCSMLLLNLTLSSWMNWKSNLI